MACKRSGVQFPLAPQQMRKGVCKMKNIVISMKCIISIFFILSFILIAYFVSYPLFDENINEINKKEVIGLKLSAPIEFSGNTNFWWLMRGQNKLEFHNSSDEKIKGIITLIFEPNPCKFEEKVNLKSTYLTSTFTLDAYNQSEIEIPIKIDKKSNTPIFLDFIEKKSCLVANSDPRDFGAKLIYWSFE